MRVRALVTCSRHVDALREGLAALAQLGIVIPADPAAQQAAFMEGIGDIDRLLAGRPLETLADAPTNEFPEDASLLALMSDLFIPAYNLQKSLYGLMVVEQVRRSVTRGNVKQSAAAYEVYGFTLCAFLGRYAEGYAFGKLAVSLCERWKSPAVAAQVVSLFLYNLHFGEPRVRHGSTRGRCPGSFGPAFVPSGRRRAAAPR